MKASTTIIYYQFKSKLGNTKAFVGDLAYHSIFHIEISLVTENTKNFYKWNKYAYFGTLQAFRSH